MLTRKQKQTIRVAYETDRRMTPELHKIAKLLFAAGCEKSEYWGQGGAGMLFVCPEDETVLLLKRGGWVDEGGTWGLSGGGIGEGYYRTPMKPLTDESVFKNTAKRETIEELGSLPPGFSWSQVKDKTEYHDCGFRFLSYIAYITLEQKNNWEFDFSDDETTQYIWYDKNKLNRDSIIKGSPLHFGIKHILKSTTL